MCTATSSGRSYGPRGALDRQTHNARWWHSHLARPSPRVADDHEIAGRIRWSEREHAYTSANRKTFDVALD
ncbi:hypothetical protein [Streptomyces sp. NPDC087317]|uniref:hypothetical protein n=1 Tax=Streptomyces sp. NPDC087317 TaxID=3365784 RepID=UPI003825ABE8